MSSTLILQGATLGENKPPPMPKNPLVKLQGKSGGQVTSFGLDADMLSKHTLLVGGTGCGKSNLFYHFVKQLKANMSDSDIMIIFDSKGDFHEKFPPAKNDVIIGNSPQYRKNSERWNIFREVLADGWDDVVINTQEICKAFFEERVSSNSSNPFFPNAARDVLASIIISLIRHGRLSDKAQTEAYAKLFWRNDFLKKIIDESPPEELVDMTQSSGQDLRKVKTYIGGRGSKQAEGVLAEMYSVADDIFRGIFAENGKFSIRDFVRKKGGRTLYIEYDLSNGSILGPIYTILFDLALKEAMGRQVQPGTKPPNVFFIVDELKLLPRLQHIDDGINFGRSLGVKIFAGLQSIEQLYANYEEADAKNIIAGFSSIYTFRANDPRTREYARDLFGENFVLERYQGTDRMLKDTVPHTGHTVEDWDLRRLEVGEAVVGLPGKDKPLEPFRFLFELYRG